MENEVHYSLGCAHRSIYERTLIHDMWSMLTLRVAYTDTKMNVLYMKSAECMLEVLRVLYNACKVKGLVV